MTGRVLGIARRSRPHAPMETLGRAAVTIERGVEGDCRGARTPGGRNRRQVTVFSLAGWQAALAELGAEIPWERRRVNILIDGVALARTKGARLRFASGIVLDVMGECDPCRRMEAVAPGLEAALRPDWRGGVISRVAAGGMLAVGDDVRIEGP